MNSHINLITFTYFSRNDFYESKILKILTLPRSKLITISFSYRLAS